MNAGNPPKIHSDRRLPSLTGLRIVAALAVYMSHIGPPGGSPEMVSSFISSGYCGVTIFFVLSGFVLAFNYFEEMKKPTPRRLYDYFVARFARVYPLYVAVLFFLVLRQHRLGLGIDGWWRNTLAIQAWDPNLEHLTAFDPPAWSIGVEFFLYACFPLLVLGLARVRRPRTILLTAGGVALAMLGLTAWFVISGRADLSALDGGSAHRWLYRTPLTRLGDFALGILAARLFVETRGRALPGKLGTPLTIGAVVVFVALMALPANLYSAWSWDVAFALPTAVLIFGLVASPLNPLARLLSRPQAVLLGEASYAFYLIHFPIIILLGASPWGEASSLSSFLYEATLLGAILALAVGLHIGFERPSRRWVRRLLMVRTEKPPPARPRQT